MTKYVKMWALMVAFIMTISLATNMETVAATKIIKSVKLQDSVTNSTKKVYIAKGVKKKLKTLIYVTDRKYDQKKYRVASIESNKPGVVSINKKGMLVAKKAGTAKVTVRTVYDNKKKTIKVVVKNGKVKEVTLNRSEANLKVANQISAAQSIQLKASVRVTKKDATSKVFWKSSDENVAVVDQTGKVTAVRIGTADIIAMSIDGTAKKGICKVNVVANPNPLPKVEPKKEPEKKEQLTEVSETVITPVSNAYINVIVSLYGDYDQAAKEIENILMKTMKSGDKFAIAVDGKDYTVENVNDVILVRGEESTKRLKDVFNQNISGTSLCLQYTKEVEKLVKNMNVADLKGNYSLSFSLDQFDYSHFVIDGEKITFQLGKTTYEAKMKDGVFVVNADLSKVPAMTLAAEKKYVTYKIVTEMK